MAEKEYIEREAVYNFCKDQLEEETGAYSKGRNAGLRVAMSAAMNKDAIPAADVRPVVRGHWITEEEAEKMDDYLKRDTCSVCGHCDWDCTESDSFNFCPNCGAMMEEIR